MQRNKYRGLMKKIINIKKIPFLIGLTFFLPLIVKAQEVDTSQDPAIQKTKEENSPQDLNKKTKSFGLTKFAIGPSWVGNLGEGGQLYSASVGHIYQVMEPAEIRLESSLAWNSKAVLWNLGIGAAWIPSHTNISPVLGGLFGLGASDGKYSSASFGLSGSVLAGIRLFKKADTQLEIMTRYTVIFDRNERGPPQELSLSIGILL